MARPTKLPEWASNPGSPLDIVEPSNTKKESGWRKILVGLDSIPEKPPYQEFNWWQNNVYQWVEKFAEGTLSANVIYVNKQGNNLNAGRSPDDAKLTIAAAIAAATADEAVIVLDSAEYAESFAINGKKVFAPSATVQGTVTFGAQGGTFVVYRHTGVNNTNMLVAGATNAQAFYEFCISEPNTSNCINIVNNADSTLNVVGGFLRAETDGITLAQDSEVKLSLRELMVGTETNGIHVNGNNATISGVISLINRWPVAMTNSIGIYVERGRASLTVSRISFPLNIKPYQVDEFGLLFLSCIDIIGDTPVIASGGYFSAVAQHSHADGAEGGVISHSNLTNKGINTHDDIDEAIANTVTPQQFGAIGDGVVDDTAAFISLELVHTNRFVNLGGKTYLVTRQPTGNEYYGGFFKRISDVKVSKVARYPTAANNVSDLILKSKWADTRYPIQTGLNGSINILGDSISHGAFAQNLYQDGWVNIFKRMINAQFGGKGYGHTPLLTLTGAATSKEVHDVTFSGAWVPLQSSTGGGDILQGLAYVSSTPGDYIEIVVPTFQSHVRIWYVEDVGSGTFSHAVNSGAATNVSTNAASRNIAKSILVSMVDDKTGKFTIRLTVVSGTVTLSGVGYETPLDAASQKAGNVVHNFSQSGRRLRYATEDVIDAACSSAVLILALGHNDQGDVETDPSYESEFYQRIDWIIQYCLKYNTTLVVADFCWWETPQNKARIALKRAATETRGIYIPYPDYMTRDSFVKPEYSVNYYQITSLKFFIDGSHPNEMGHKWIAETMATELGLSCSSKEDALAYYDYPWPLQFEPASIFENQFTTSSYISLIQRVGKMVILSIRLKTKSGAAIPVGVSYIVNKQLNPANSRQLQHVNTTSTTNVASLTAAGLVNCVVFSGLFNNVFVTCFNLGTSVVDNTLAIPLDDTYKKA